MLKEVYDRLDQIYGFPHFNYPTLRKDDTKITNAQSDDGIFLKELLSSGSTSSSPLDAFLERTATSDTLSVEAGMETSMDGGTATTTTTPTATATGSSTNVPKESSTLEEILSELPPFQQFRVLHMDPLVLAIDDFFTPDECDRYIAMVNTPHGKNSPATPYETRSKTVGKDALAKSQRTSTTWFNHYRAVPEFISKASRLLGLDGIDRWEEPQTVRYVGFHFHFHFHRSTRSWIEAPVWLLSHP